MYLKALELQGFKSFPDKIQLTFGQGMTAVVGPNGSGKSNIGDAVRWVLGEQSTKTLRGSKMEDVIFSGTEARRPVGFAAVTLTIDNQDQTLAEQPETVAVTRKLYRNGESEYLLNGKAVRLKDINELFMDTGLGRDGYSIIGQGKIAEIVSAKSGERRDIFEEAAGISKFRYRKEEAQRRLNAAQDNILRLTDIVSELESRLGPLKSQAAKAERYLELAAQRKVLELSVWTERLKNLRARLDTLEEEALSAAASYENIQSDLEREEAKVQEGFSSMQSCSVKMEQLRNALLALEQENGEWNSKIAVCENEIQHCLESLSAAQQAIEQEQLSHEEALLRVEAQAQTVAALKAQQEEADKELKKQEANLSALGAQNADADQAISTRSDALSMLYRDRYKAALEQSAAAERMQELEARKTQLCADRKTRMETAEQYGAAEQTLKRELAQAEAGCAEQQNRLNGYQRLLEHKMKKLELARQSLDSLTDQLREKQQRRKILSDLEKSMEGFGHSVRQILQAARSGALSGIHGTVAQLIGVAPDYATAIETALGGSMQHLITTNEDAAKRGIRLLKERKGGRATFLPLTSIQGTILKEAPQLRNADGFVALASELVTCEAPYRQIVNFLLGRTAVAEDLDSGSLLAKEFHYRFRIVTLDGQVINAGGSFTGGSSAGGTGIITRKNELEALSAQLETLEQSQQTQKADFEQLRAETAKLQLELEAAKDALANANAERVRCESSLSGMENLSRQAREIQESMAEQLAQIQAEQEALQTAELQAAETLSGLEEVIRQSETELTEAQSRQSGLSQQWQQCKDAVSECYLKQMTCQKDLSAANAALQMMQESLIRSDERQQTLSDEQERLRKRSAELQSSVSNYQTRLQQNKETAVSHRQEIDIQQETHTQIQQHITQMQQGMQGLRDEKERISVERSRIDERKAGTQKEYDGIISQMQEVYELTRSEAAAIAEPLEDMQAAQRKLTELKNQIRALGHVNVEAVEEYREVSERCGYLTAQLGDVTTSKRELEQLIEDLTSEMCKIFSESFQCINQNFCEIFRELFGGGKAQLTLTDPEHVLESGIEISVAPPGKVIKNLISLSGGEQAFVAICIYFAILKLRPAPFCILDEIDAALDEANVRKFAQYLRNFTTHTQFVVVTHRRGAMEEADVLYGVTMQKDGISRLLRLDLEEAVSGSEQ